MCIRDRYLHITGSVLGTGKLRKFDQYWHVIGNVSLGQASYINLISTCTYINLTVLAHHWECVFGTSKLYKFDQYWHIIGSVSLGQASYINLISTCTSLGVCL